MDDLIPEDGRQFFVRVPPQDDLSDIEIELFDAAEPGHVELILAVQDSAVTLLGRADDLWRIFGAVHAMLDDFRKPIHQHVRQHVRQHGGG